MIDVLREGECRSLQRWIVGNRLWSNDLVIVWRYGVLGRNQCIELRIYDCGVGSGAGRDRLIIKLIVIEIDFNVFSSLYESTVRQTIHWLRYCRDDPRAQFQVENQRIAIGAFDPWLHLRPGLIPNRQNTFGWNIDPKNFYLIEIIRQRFAESSNDDSIGFAEIQEGWSQRSVSRGELLVGPCRSNSNPLAQGVTIEIRVKSEDQFSGGFRQNIRTCIRKDFGRVRGNRQEPEGIGRTSSRGGADTTQRESQIVKLCLRASP